MVTVLTILHIIVCVFLIFVVLLQAGKGGGMGLAFGSGQAATMFGGSGAGNLLTRVTAATAIVFMLTSLTLAYLASKGGRSDWLKDVERTSDAQAKREAAAMQKLASDAGPKAEAPQPPAPASSEAPATPATPAEESKPETPAPEKAPAKAEEKPADKAAE